jgi:tRNA pseudouridine38-40 synthase
MLGALLSPSPTSHRSGTTTAIIITNKRFSSTSSSGSDNKDDNLSSRLKLQKQQKDSSSLLPPHLRKGRDVSLQSKQVTFQPSANPTRLLEVDDDDDNIHPSLMSGTSSIDVVDEYELVDDAHTYFPLINTRGDPLHDDPTPAAAAAADLYIPGQQVIDPGFTRYRVDVQYMGSDFDGWYKSTEKRSRLIRDAERAKRGDDDDELLYAAERKNRAKSVLEDALAVALDVERVNVEAGAIPEVGCSVRRLTCHVDIPDSNPLQPRTIMQRATAWLEKKSAPMAILSCHPCRNQQFHARHSGTKRVYVYRILNRIAPPLFDAGFQWHVDRYLDVDRMQRFADRLQGTMDYGYFADAKMAHALRREAGRVGGAAGGRNQSSSYKVGKGGDVTAVRDVAAAAASSDFTGPLSATVRTVETLRVVRQDEEILIWFAGKSFLRHQIRNMVSVLRLAGQGLWSEQELDQALARGFTSSRTKAERERPESAPVHGLTLWSVEYPAEHSDSFIPYVDSGPLPQDGEDVRVVRTF